MQRRIRLYYVAVDTLLLPRRFSRGFMTEFVYRCGFSITEDTFLHQPAGCDWLYRN